MISRKHAILTKNEAGTWSITDNKVCYNGKFGELLSQFQTCPRAPGMGHCTTALGSSNEGAGREALRRSDFLSDIVVSSSLFFLFYYFKLASYIGHCKKSNTGDGRLMDYG